MAEPFADAGDTRVTGDFKDRSTHFVHGFQLVLGLFGICDHRAEFVKREWRAVQTGTLLFEKHGTRRSDFDQRSQKREQP